MENENEEKKKNLRRIDQRSSEREVVKKGRDGDRGERRVGRER